MLTKGIGLTQAHVGRRLIVENLRGARFDGIVQAVTPIGCIMRPYRVALGDEWQNLGKLDVPQAIRVARVCDGNEEA